MKPKLSTNINKEAFLTTAVPVKTMQTGIIFVLCDFFVSVIRDMESFEKMLLIV